MTDSVVHPGNTDPTSLASAQTIQNIDWITTPCPACGSSEFTIAHTGKDWILNSATPTRIVRCDSCGLHYTNPRPADHDLGKFYPNDYAPYQGEEKDKTPPPGSLREAILLQAYGPPERKPRGLRRYIAMILLAIKGPESFGFGVPWHGQGRLLDFGCGGGKFLKRMTSVGWKTTGIDFSEAAVEAVRKKGIPVYQGTLPNENLAPGSFDIVTMRHSLEHVPDPVAILKAARDLLAKDGNLIIRVPNFASWEVDYFGDASPRLDIPRHLTHFTPATLKAMLEQSGYETIAVKQICRANWLRKAAKLSERGPRRKFAFLFRITFFCRIAALASQLAGRGNEIIAIARLPGEKTHR
jgi:2-polyprenyl-3-methyl-5-hydroxy-6-metoxy-1,4-benzoquinol methylase